MTASVRSKLLALVAVLACGGALAACGGGGGGGGDGGSSGDKPSAGDAAKDRKAIAALIKQVYAANPKADSGKVDGTIDVEVKGVPRYKGPIELTLTGGFELADGADAPDLNLEVGLVLNDHAIDGSLVLANPAGYIQAGDTGYKLPASITSQIVAPAASSKLGNGLVKSAGMFHIRPDRWQQQGRVVGDESVAGVMTTHATAGVRPDRFFADVSRLVDMLTLLRVTESVGLPTKISPKALAALARSVKSAQGDVYVGKDDHVLRKAHLEGKLVVAKRDRKVLHGMTSATLSADFNVTDVGTSQNIHAPRKLGSYDDLQLTLDALGESIRNSLRGK